MEKLKDWANKVVEGAQRNVGAVRKIDGKNRRTDSSGNLRRGLGFEIVDKGGAILVNFTSDQNYAAFVHDGVRGAKSSPISTKNSIFKYKKAFGNYGTKGEKFKDSIMTWAKKKPLRLRKNGKFAKTTKSARESQAFLIMRKIINHGMSANPFFEDSIKERLPELQDLDISILGK